MFSDNIISLDGPFRRRLPSLRKTLRGFFRLWTHEKQYRHLEDLPDYLLDDVGLTRADLHTRKRWPYL